ELLVDLGVAVLQVDVLELVEGESLLDDAFDVRALAAPARGDEVRVAELDLVLARDDADLLEVVLGAIVDLANLVRDPELEAMRLLGRHDRDLVLLAPILERDAHEPFADDRLILARLAALTEGGLLHAVFFRLGALVIGLRLDDRVVEVAAARALVLV